MDFPTKSHYTVLDRKSSGFFCIFSGSYYYLSADRIIYHVLRDLR